MTYKMNEQYQKVLTEMIGEKLMNFESIDNLTGKEREMAMGRNRAKKWRFLNKKKHTEYTRQWRQEHQVNARQHSKNNYQKNKIKHRVHRTVYKALKSGKIIKPQQCEQCGSDKFLHGHHDDYSKPLEVQWLCRLCHKGKHQCKEFWPEEYNACAYCRQFRENLVFDNIGYLRTKECIKREIKEDK